MKTYFFGAAIIKKEKNSRERKFLWYENYFLLFPTAFFVKIFLTVSNRARKNFLTVHNWSIVNNSSWLIFFLCLVMTTQRLYMWKKITLLLLLFMWFSMFCINMGFLWTFFSYNHWRIKWNEYFMKTQKVSLFFFGRLNWEPCDEAFEFGD